MAHTYKRIHKLPKDQARLLKRIGELVHEGMVNQDDTTESLSKRAGVARSTLREVIAGRSNVRVGSLFKITREIGWDLSSFLIRAEKE